MAKSSSLSKTAMWILMGLLIIGLAGFGANSLGGTLRTVGTVGDKSISTQSYFTAIQREISQVEQRTGEPMTFARFRDIGLDQAVLQRLVTLRAMDHEASKLGLSVGDENLRRQVLEIPNFQGLDGSFDREAYAFALENQGLSEAEFEGQLREETARTILQGAVLGGVKMPNAFADALVSYAGEQRDFTWAILDASALDDPLVVASDEELRAYHSENAADFVLPETKQITYAWLTPEMLVDEVDLDEDALRAAYDLRIDDFVQPERRLVERLAFLDDTAANDAAAQLDVDGTTFEALVEGRGLDLSDVDLGDVGRLELGSAGEAVFAGEVGDVVGPLPSDLGPALFRINGIFPARSTSFEDARADLREVAAIDRARRVIDAQAESYDDLLAGGATLEDVAKETDMQLGSIDWTQASGTDIAAYEQFRAAAAALSETDYPQIQVLEDGGVFAMRLDAQLPERPEPFESAKDAVTVALEQTRTETALSAKADTLLPQLLDGTDFADLALTATIEEGRTRGAFVPDVPPSFLTSVFEMNVGEVQALPATGRVILVRLDEIAPADNSDEAAQLGNILQETLDQALAQDVFNIFTSDVALRAEPQIDPRAIEAVNANFP